MQVRGYGAPFYCRHSCSSQLQPLGAALGEQGAEPELKSFCVLGVAPKGSTALIDHAAYLFTALTSRLWSSTSRDREALYPGLHQPLMQYVGYGVPRTPLLGTPVNKAPAGHRASGRGTMEADLTNTTKEVLRAFPTAACDRRERR